MFKTIADKILDVEVLKEMVVTFGELMRGPYYWVYIASVVMFIIFMAAVYLDILREEREERQNR